MNETTALVAYANSQGWDVDPNGKHYKLTSPDGKLVVIPSTPSDWRSIKNSVAELRRNGLIVPRKAPRTKRVTGPNIAVESATDEGVDIDICPFPHISEILGLYRSRSWFDKDMMPKDEESWGGPDEATINAAVLMGELTDMCEAPGLLAISFKQGKNARSLPGMRTRRIWADAFKYWTAGEAYTDSHREPQLCACGFSARDAPDNAIFLLAEHIVVKHERADYGHFPLGELWPYAEPSVLDSLFDPDERDTLIERQQAMIERLEKRLETATEQLRGIRRILG